MNNKFFEWAGVITAILYSLFVALNIGIEFFGFCLLLIISNFNWNLGLSEEVIKEYFYCSSFTQQLVLLE